MKPFGLTGNIGCGKSTVASLLARFPDVKIFDCDDIAKEIISNGGYNNKIEDILEAKVFSPNGPDFKTIATIIFHQSEKRLRLEALIHPLVWKVVEEKMEDLGDRFICIVESAIMYEKGSDKKFSSVIVVACNQDEQFRRLRKTRKMEDVAIQARLDQQLPQEKKIQRAQFVVYTDCTLKELEGRVGELHQKLKKQAGGVL